MDSFDDYKAFLKIEQSDWWSELVEIIYDQIEDNVTLAGLCKMHDNSEIAIAVIGSNCKKYFDFDHAYSTLRSNKYMILVKEIGIYCIFDDIESYKKLCKEINATLFQIVNNYEMQKIAFYVNNDDMDNFKLKCEEYFGKEVSIDEEYIVTIEEEVKNFEELNTVVDLFKVYVNNVDIHVADLKVSMDGMQYLMYKIISGDEKSLKYWLKEEKFDIGGVGYDYSNIDNGNNDIDNINLSVNNKLYMSKTEMKTDIATKWIKSNLPSDGKSTTEYYGEYKQYLSNKDIGYIRIDTFNKIVRDSNVNADFEYKNQKDTDNKHKWYLVSKKKDEIKK